MKKTLTLIVACFLFTLSAYAYEKPNLAGRTYSRTFTSTPLGAPGPVSFTHSMQFKANGIVVDDANTFFGNPPQSCSYVITKANRVIVACPGHEDVTTWTLSADQTLLEDGNIVLTLH